MISVHERLRTVFRSSFAKFVERETLNILNRVAERNLCACWAPLLEKAAIDAGFESYRADAEYNRMQDGRVKTMLSADLVEVSISCDLILHSRGVVVSCDNLIAIEMKWSNRPKKEKEADRLRLKTLTSESFDGIWSPDGVTLPEYVCGYKLGYYVEINSKKRSFLIEEYIKGLLVGNNIESF